MKPGSLPDLDNIQSESCLLLIYRAQELLVYGDSLPTLENIDLKTLNLCLLRQFYLGKQGERHCYVAEVASDFQPPPTMSFKALRQSLEEFTDDDLVLLASKASQALLWDSNTQFCGHCGAKMEFHTIEAAKSCPKCHALFYPQFSAVVMVAIRRGPELLLARSPHFPPGVYSILAGFVEIGESLEQAVHREVAEEVGIRIKNLRYFGSQPWPFPNNLMIGFIADYAEGELVIDNVEIEDAQWFLPSQLPPLPKKFTLSRRLIDAVLEKRLAI